MFGLSSLKEKKSHQEILERDVELDILIVGNASFAEQSKVLFSSENNIENSAQVTSDAQKNIRYILSSDQCFSDQLKSEVSLSRGQELFDYIQAQSQSVNDVSEEESSPKLSKEPIVYSDQKFKPFSKLKKSELEWFENFYSKPKVLIPDQMLKNENRVEAPSFEIEKSHIIDSPVISIASNQDSQSSDFKWRVELLNGQVFVARKIIWAGPIKNLVHAFEQKEDFFTKDELECAWNHNFTSVLKVSFELKSQPIENDIFGLDDTLFIPQNQSRDEGFYVLEKELISDSHFFLNSIFPVDPQESSEEELTRRFKHLKRTIKRLFPDELENPIGESIQFCRFGLVFDGTSFQKEFGERMRQEGIIFVGSEINWCGEASAYQVNFEKSLENIYE